MAESRQDVCPTGFRRFLLATEDSEFNEGAIREAINLAKVCLSRLTVISVVETNPEFETLAPQLVEKVEIKTREHLESVKSRALKEGVECEIVAHRGEEPYQYIVDEAEKKQIDMIVMGKEEKTGLKRLVVGSVTAKVIGHSPCSVLVVPKSARIECRKILAATDGSKYSDSAVKEAIAIAKSCGAALTVISVVPSETAFLLDIVHSEMQREMIAERELKAAECAVKGVKEISDKEGVRIEELILAGRPYEAIINTAKEKGADLIVLGSHGKTGLDRLLMGSVAERVVVLSPCAVLVVKSKQD